MQLALSANLDRASLVNKIEGFHVYIFVIFLHIDTKRENTTNNRPRLLKVIFDSESSAKESGFDRVRTCLGAPQLVPEITCFWTCV